MPTNFMSQLRKTIGAQLTGRKPTKNTEPTTNLKQNTGKVKIPKGFAELFAATRKNQTNPIQTKQNTSTITIGDVVTNSTETNKSSSLSRPGPIPPPPPPKSVVNLSSSLSNSTDTNRSFSPGPPPPPPPMPPGFTTQKQIQGVNTSDSVTNNKNSSSTSRNKPVNNSSKTAQISANSIVAGLAGLKAKQPNNLVTKKNLERSPLQTLILKRGQAYRGNNESNTEFNT